MGDEAWQAFSQRVVFEDSLPLTLEPWAGRDGAELVEEHNLQVLATLAALDERRPEPGEESGALMQELARLDGKLNALMEIVGRLLMPDHALPRRWPIRFNAVGAEVPAALWDARPGAHLLKIHFDACRALPLTLPVVPADGPADGRIFLAFDAPGPAVGEGLEKLVFRQHRRKVAEARQSGP